MNCNIWPSSNFGSENYLVYQVLVAMNFDSILSVVWNWCVLICTFYSKKLMSSYVQDKVHQFLAMALALVGQIDKEVQQAQRLVLLLLALWILDEQLLACHFNVPNHTTTEPVRNEESIYISVAVSRLIANSAGRLSCLLRGLVPLHYAVKTGLLISRGVLHDVQAVIRGAQLLRRGDWRQKSLRLQAKPIVNR